MLIARVRMRFVAMGPYTEVEPSSWVVAAYRLPRLGATYTKVWFSQCQQVRKVFRTSAIPTCVICNHCMPGGCFYLMPTYVLCRPAYFGGLLAQLHVCFYIPLGRSSKKGKQQGEQSRPAYCADYTYVSQAWPRDRTNCSQYWHALQDGAIVSSKCESNRCLQCLSELFHCYSAAATPATQTGAFIFPNGERYGRACSESWHRYYCHCCLVLFRRWICWDQSGPDREEWNGDSSVS